MLLFSNRHLSGDFDKEPYQLSSSKRQTDGTEMPAAYIGFAIVGPRDKYWAIGILFNFGTRAELMEH